MDKTLLRMLSDITAEEQHILDGNAVDMGLYSDAGRGSVDAAKLLEGKLIDVRAHTRFAVFPRHRHDFVEIMYVCAGSVTHVLGERAVCVKAGELLFLGRNSWHEIRPAGKGDIGVNFLVRPAFFRTAFDLMDEPNMLGDFIVASLAGEGAADEYIHFAVAQALPVQNLVENLVYALCHGGEGGEKQNELTMGLLFLHLMRFAPSAQTGGGAPRALALRALTYIDGHCADATLRSFAKENGIAEYTASRIIKAQLGASFRALLRERRFALALQMLRTTALSVNDIIAAVGYENTSYFYRTFSQKHGCTPQEYRRAGMPE